MEEYHDHSLRGRVFQKIREDILTGVYKEHDELREVSIGEELGVSRTPVREALRQLELEGLVTIVPNKGAYVTGITPQDVVDRYHTLIKDSFKEFGISFDVYSRTSSKTHHELASEFFKTLYDKGEFIEKTSEQYYDEEAHQFLADRYITGECPHCHAEGAYGDQCEKCGTSLSPTDLINPKSAISGSKPVMRETKHWYLPLDKHEGWLRKWILEDHKEWRPNVYG